MKKGEMAISGRKIEIQNINIVEAINILKNKGYYVIAKYENTTHFQRWSNLDNGRGVAYSIDGSEPRLEFLTKLEKLPEHNWYYYEEDYNEWRIRNKKNKTNRP